MAAQKIPEPKRTKIAGIAYVNYAMAAELLGVHHSFVRRIPARDLPRSAMGHRTVLIAEVDLNNYLRKKRVRR